MDDAPDLMGIDGANTHIPFSQKWELHKPLLERLYLDEGFKLPKIQSVMREQGFDAE
jgi:hypothetical protein